MVHRAIERIEEHLDRVDAYLAANLEGPAGLGEKPHVEDDILAHTAYRRADLDALKDALGLDPGEHPAAEASRYG